MLVKLKLNNLYLFISMDRFSLRKMLSLHAKETRIATTTKEIS